MGKMKVPAEPPAPIRCLANALQAMQRRRLAVAELARLAGIDIPLLRAALLCRISLDRAERDPLSAALGIGSWSVAEIGEMPPGEIRRILYEGEPDES